MGLDRAIKPTVEQNPKHEESLASAQAGAGDRHLCSRAQAGDREAFDTLVRQYEGLVFRSAVALTQSARQAETVVLDTFTYAYRHLAEWQAGSTFGEWLMRITVRCAQLAAGATQDAAESVETEPSLPPRTCPAWPDTAGSRLSRKQRDAIIQTALVSLPFRQRCVFVLRDVASFPTARVAAILQLNEQLTRRRLLVARLKVREALALHLAEPRGIRPMVRMLVWMVYGMMTGRMVRPMRGGKDLTP